MISDTETSERRAARVRNHRITLTWPGRTEHTFGVDVLEKLKQLVPEGKVLEIGSSVGFTTEELSHIFGDQVQVFGVEINAGVFGEKGAIKRALYRDVGIDERAYVEGGRAPYFLNADGLAAPFAPNSFEAVFAMNNLMQMIQHNYVTSEQLQVILANIWRVLKPHGFFCVSKLESYLIVRLDGNKKASVFAEKDNPHVSAAADYSSLKQALEISIP